MPISIKFLPENRVVEASQDETLLEVALREGIELPHSCGGHGTCGTCRVWAVQGFEGLAQRNEVEQDMAQDRGFHPQERLSCQTYPVTNLVLELPENDLED